MKTESFQEGLLISELIRLSTQAAPVWTLVSGAGCSSFLDMKPGSMKATEGSVPAFTSARYCETGTTLLGSELGGAYPANWLKYVQAPLFDGGTSAFAEAGPWLCGGAVVQISSV